MPDEKSLIRLFVTQWPCHRWNTTDKVSNSSSCTLKLELLISSFRPLREYLSQVSSTIVSLRIHTCFVVHRRFFIQHPSSIVNRENLCSSLLRTFSLWFLFLAISIFRRNKSSITKTLKTQRYWIYILVSSSLTDYSSYFIINYWEIIKFFKMLRVIFLLYKNVTLKIAK